MTKDDMVMEVSDQEFNKIVSSGQQLVVVDFFAEWCMPCLMLSPVIEELAQEMQEVKFVKINVDGNLELAGKYRVSSIPCLVFFKDGKEVDRIIGNVGQEAIAEKISEYIN